jgi:hypothetical protein
MTSSEHGWQEVAENFTALGKRLRDRVREPGEEGGKEDAEVTSALKQFTEAAERLGDRLNATVKDEEIRQGAQQAVRSLGDAMKGTFTGLSHEVKDLIDRRRGEGGAGDAEDSTQQPASGPAALPPTPPPSDPVTGDGDSRATDGTP